MAKASVRSEKLLLLIVAIAIFLDGMDGSIVNIALPTIALSLGTDTASASWVTVAYFMVLAGLILLFGRISDMGAVKKVFIYGFSIFTIASLFCGISNSLIMLLISRVIQGIGAAMLAAASPMLCVKYVSLKKLGFALSVITFGSAIGYSLGPPLGGILTDFLSWHWIFLINIPIGLIAIPLAFYAVPKDGAIEKRPIDLTGATLLFFAIALGIFTLEISGDPKNTIYTIIATFTCLTILTIFVIHELRSRQPMIDVRIFRSLRFSSAFMANMTLNITYMGIFYLLPFYMSLCLGFTASYSALYLLVPSVITAVICLPFGKLSDRLGRRWFAVIACIVMLSYNVILWFMVPDNGHWILIPVMILMGLCWGISGGPMGSRVVEHAPEGHGGMGSSMMSLSLYLGFGVGTALFAAIFSIASGSPGKSFSLLSIPEFTSGFSIAVLAAILTSIMAIVLSYVVKDSKRFSKVLKDTEKPVDKTIE